MDSTRPIRYVEIIPTHRYNFIKSCLVSIVKQKVKPNRIICIIDSYTDENIENLQNLIYKFAEDYQIVIDIIIKDKSESGSAINAFKNCFYEANHDNDTNKDFNNYYHIQEDDVKYIRNKAIGKYLELLELGHDFIYSPLIDIHNGVIINGDIILTKGLVPIKDLPENILDTCSIIFSGKNVNGFCEYIKDKDYVLNGDMYFFKWFLNQSDKPISVTETYISSKIHSDQVTSNLFNQILGTQYIWYNDFKFKNKRLKYEARLMNNYSIRAAIDYFNIDIQEIKYKFPTKLIIKSLIKYQNKGIQNCLKEYETFLRNHQKELKWLLNIELKPNEIDYHPNLRYLQEIK